MTLKSEIESQRKQALKAGEKDRLSTLRFLLSALNNREIELQHPLTDGEVIEVVQRQIKQHRESITAYSKGRREDLAAKEREEMAILQTFVPQMLKPDELQAIVQKAVRTLPVGDQQNFGLVMKTVMAEVGSRAEGRQVAELVRKVL